MHGDVEFEAEYFSEAARKVVQHIIRAFDLDPKTLIGELLQNQKGGLILEVLAPKVSIVEEEE
jgi:hypothetical protein